jgi:hypothetical protein
MNVMSTDEMLKRLRYLSEKIQSDASNPKVEGIDVDEALELAALFEHFDNVLQNNGFLPRDWE